VNKEISYIVKLKDVEKLIGDNNLNKLLKEESIKVSIKDTKWETRINRFKEQSGSGEVETFVVYDKLKGSFYLDVYEV